MNDQLSLGKEFKQLRLAAKLSQSELAFKAGISTRQYQRIETNISVPTLDTLFAVAHVLNADPMTIVKRHLERWHDHQIQKNDG